MSLRIYTKKGKEKLKLNPKPFASGGEGHLYKIHSPVSLNNCVVKIYHSHKLSPAREEKINYLLEHPPTNMDQSVVWVKDAVEDDRGHFVGFIMPFVKGEKLEILCTNKLPKKLANSWYRFHEDAADVLDLRLKVCFNLAAAIHQIHATERYILVDLKPDNVIITPEGLISLVDLDSVEVVENGYKLFDAPVATPEYTPPEHYRKNESDPTQQLAWDRFSLAVIFYKLLIGLHPFAGSFKPPFDKANTLSEKIEQGLFVHSPNMLQYKKAIPPLHQDFFRLSSDLQRLFYTCFVEGSVHPQLRPTAHEWCSAITQHLDLHRLRVLPSQKVTMPINTTELLAFQQKEAHPDAFLESLAPLEDKEILPTKPQKTKSSILHAFRKITWSIFVFGLIMSISFMFFQNDIEFGLTVLGISSFVFATLILFSFGQVVNNDQFFAIKSACKEAELFFQKQQSIFKGIKKHLDVFYTKLAEEHQQLFSPTKGLRPDNIAIEIEGILNGLQISLDQTDKAAQDLMDSETFEYRALKEKYNRALHTYPDFAKASSLDAELSAIDFALQEEMEYIQKTLGRELKTTQLEYDELFEKDQLALENKKREYNKKVGKFKKHLQQAKKQEVKKIFVKMKRQLMKDLASVADNADTRLTLFKDEILAFLSRFNITDMHQIKNIQSPGKVTLASGKVVSIAPLRYYQIHELLEWWMAADQGKVDIPQNLMDEISSRYEKEFNDYKKIAKKEYSKFEEAVLGRKKEIQKEALTVFKQLRERNEPQILNLKKKYKAQKDFLKKLFKERDAEEAEIHKRYELKFEALQQDIQKKADLSNSKIKALYQIHTIDPTKIKLYQANSKKYQLGLHRLKEEYLRLENKDKSLKKIKLKLETYEEITMVNHLKRMLFLKELN